MTDHIETLRRLAVFQEQEVFENLCSATNFAAIAARMEKLEKIAAMLDEWYVGNLDDADLDEGYGRLEKCE